MEKKNHGFFASILGASCCILPLILLAAGLGGSLLTIFLVRYKAYLMTFAAGFLIYSWVLYRRDAKLCATQLCELTGGKLRKWLLGVNTAVVMFFFIITYTPAGALVGVDYVGESSVTAEANVLSGSMTVGPASALRTLAPNASGTTSGATRMERLALRVEGMA